MSPSDVKQNTLLCLTWACFISFLISQKFWKNWADWGAKINSFMYPSEETIKTENWCVARRISSSSALRLSELEMTHPRLILRNMTWIPSCKLVNSWVCPSPQLPLLHNSRCTDSLTNRLQSWLSVPHWHQWMRGLLEELIWIGSDWKMSPHSCLAQIQQCSCSSFYARDEECSRVRLCSGFHLVSRGCSSLFLWGSYIFQQYSLHLKDCRVNGW